MTKTQIKKERNQLKLYRFVVTFYVEKGFLPTLKDIADHFKISRERARQRIDDMIRDDRLTKVDDRRLTADRSYEPKIISEWIEQIIFK